MLARDFPDVQSILIAWHERVIAAHLGELAALADRPGTAGQRLRAVLGAYAAIEHAHRDHPLAAALHGGAHHLEGRRRLRALLAGLLEEAGRAGELRDDVAPDELAAYCVSALGAAREVTDDRGRGRIAALTLDALRR